MIIESITITNFRQFRGEHKIYFSTDNDRNVTVVMGKNGTGKTTLEQAFRWCLYEKTDFKNQQLINIELQNAMVVTESKLVSVKLCVRFENKLYSIDRRYYFKKKTLTSFYSPTKIFKIKCQNKNGDWEEIPENLKIPTVQKMLPENLSGFFFFDGEHIESMSEELLQKKRSDSFKQAVEALVGLNAMQSAVKHFNPDSTLSVTGRFSKEIQNVPDGELSEINKSIEAFGRSITDCQEKREKYKVDCDDAERRIKAVESELQSMQEDINNRAKYAEYNRKIDEEEKQQEKDCDETFRQFAKDTFNILLMPLMKQALEELRTTEKIDKGIPHMHAQTIKFLLDRGRCICGNDLTRNQECINRMQELMDSLPPNNLGTMIGNFVKDIRQGAKTANGLGNNFITQGSRYMQHDSKIEEYEAEKNLLNSNLADTSKVAMLNQRKRDLENLKHRLRDSISKCDVEYGGYKREKERLEKKRDTIISNETRNRTNKLYYIYAKTIYDKLQSIYSVKVAETRDELEKTINEIFNDIYDSQIGIEINKDYSIRTYLKNNTPGADNLEKNTAQSYAVIFAFIAGIIKMHKENQEQQGDGLPMVMDAPLSAFDKDRIKSICKALPRIAQQIIIFIKDTDGDIAEEHMSNVIGKKWLIHADSQTSSRIVERG